MKTKQERFRIFLNQLAAAPEATSQEEALGLLVETLNHVEDMHSGAPYAPDEHLSDGRMYPPQADAVRTVKGRPDWVRYRSRGHNTWITSEGAIRITTVPGDEIIFEKAGLNGVGFE